MAPKKTTKRPRDDAEPTATEEVEPSKPSDLESIREDALVREGENLSGAKLRAFLKKNFLDFADQEYEKIIQCAEAMNDTVETS